MLGEGRQAYRSGLLDAGFRLVVNLKGGRAMSVPEFVKRKQRALLGASLKVIAPPGQYDPEKLINWGTNRWTFKPEFGYSQRFGKWILDGYVGVWFTTTNSKSFSIPTPQPQSLNPIGSFEGHRSYNLKPFLWVAVDGSWDFYFFFHFRSTQLARPIPFIDAVWPTRHLFGPSRA